jgi:hypothetical protein
MWPKKMFGKFYSWLKKGVALIKQFFLKHYSGEVLPSSGGYMDVQH